MIPQDRSLTPAEKRFRDQKENALRKLGEAEVDDPIRPLVGLINSLSDLYTTSSCSGRISLLVDLGKKPLNYWLGKWHSPASFEEVKGALKRLPERGLVWFKVEPAILHVVARSLEKAKLVMKAARRAGYKRVGLQGLREGRFVVEICDTEQMSVPVAKGGKLLIGEEYLRCLIHLANEKLEKSSEKLKKLEREFKGPARS